MLPHTSPPSVPGLSRSAAVAGPHRSLPWSPVYPPRVDTLEAPRFHEPRLTRRLIWIGMALAVALVGVIAWAIVDGSHFERPATGLATATIDDIVDSPRLYDGRTVTVVGEAGKATPAASAFDLVDDDILFDDRLVVVNATGEPLDVVEDGAYRVTGAVRVLDREGLAISPDLDFEWRAVADLGAEAVLIARRIEPVAPDGTPAD